MVTDPLFQIKLHLLSTVLLGRFQKQYPVNFTGLADIINATVSSPSQFSQVSAMSTCPNFEHCNE